MKDLRLDSLGAGDGVNFKSENLNLPNFAEFDSKTLVTNIDDATWTFAGSASVTKQLTTEHSGSNNSTVNISTPAIAGVNGYGNGILPTSVDVSADDFIEINVFADGFDPGSPTWLSFFMISSVAPATTDYFSLNVALLVAGWNIIKIDKSAFNVVGTPSWSNIGWVRLRCNSSTRMIHSVYYSSVYGVKNRQRSAILSLGFDDANESQIFAARLAASRGIPITHFLIYDLIGTPNYLTVEQLSEINTMGHELAMHGGTMGNYVNWPIMHDALGHAGFVDAIKTIRNSLTALGVGVDTTLTSYPQGQTVSNNTDDSRGGLVVAGLREAGIKYSRLTSVADNISGLHVAQYSKNHPRNTLLISGGASLNNANTLVAVQTLVDNLINNGGWLNIYGHNLADTAANDVTWDTASYIALLDYLADKVDKGLLVIKPFGTVARELDKDGFLSSEIQL